MNHSTTTPIDQKTAGRPITVLKVSGRQVQHNEAIRQLAEHAAQLRADRDLVIVHGGGDEIATLQQKLEIDERKCDGLRVTTEETMPLVTMTLAGLVNKRLAAQLVGHGINALGICGADLGLLRADFLDRERFGRVGGAPLVEHEVLRGLLAQRITPVIAPVCLGPDNDLLNVNADTVARSIAVALGASRLEFVSDVPGVRTGQGVAATLDAAQIQALREAAVISAGMLPKLEAALAAARGGVAEVWVGNLESLGRGAATEVRA